MGKFYKTGDEQLCALEKAPLDKERMDDGQVEHKQMSQEHMDKEQMDKEQMDKNHMNNKQKNNVQTTHGEENLFLVGDAPSLEEVLDNREARQARFESFERTHPDAVLVSFQLNIPGPVKRNAVIEEMFAQGVLDIDAVLDPFGVLESKTGTGPTGPEALWIIRGEDCAHDETKPEEKALSVKKSMVDIEETATLGRLYDIDVRFHGNGLKRNAVGQPPRKCFLCDGEAKACARSRRHTVEEMQRYLTALYRSWKVSDRSQK